jgi:hypothetical protein
VCSNCRKKVSCSRAMNSSNLCGWTCRMRKDVKGERVLEAGTNLDNI